MKGNWQLYLKRAFRLAELLVAFALLAVLVELLLVHLDQPTAGPDVRLIKRTKLVETPAQNPMTPPAKAMFMQVAAKPVRPVPPPVVAAPAMRNDARESMGAGGNNTTINFVSLLQFRHVRSRFGQPVNDAPPVQAPVSSPAKPNFSFVVIGPSGISVPGTTQPTVMTNSVASTNATNDSVSVLASTNDKRPEKSKPSAPPSPAFGTIRLALP